MDPDVDARTVLKTWLHHRLTEGDRPKEEWRSFLESAWEHLLTTRVRDLIEPRTAKSAADDLLDTTLIAEISGTLTAAVAPVMMAEMRADDQPLGRLLPEEARDRVEEAMGRPGLVQADWVRAAFRGETAEAVLNDALYRALTDFLTGLPRVLSRVSPLGRFAALRGAGVMAERTIKDLGGRLEPEIRSFLSDNTGPMLARAAEFAVSRIDDPASLELRVTLVRFILAASPSSFLEALDDELAADIVSIAELTARHVPVMPQVRGQAHAWIDRMMESAGDKTLGEALHIMGAEARPRFDALAAASWPALTTLLQSPQARTWIDNLVDELVEEYDRVKPESPEPGG